jgi:hypothetical protein
MREACALLIIDKSILKVKDPDSSLRKEDAWELKSYFGC